MHRNFAWYTCTCDASMHVHSHTHIQKFWSPQVILLIVQVQETTMQTFTALWYITQLCIQCMVKIGQQVIYDKLLFLGKPPFFTTHYKLWFHFYIADDLQFGMIFSLYPYLYILHTDMYTNVYKYTHIQTHRQIHTPCAHSHTYNTRTYTPIKKDIWSFIL